MLAIRESEELYPTSAATRTAVSSTLLRRDENLNIVNDLATDYSISEDCKT